MTMMYDDDDVDGDEDDGDLATFVQGARWEPTFPSKSFLK